MKTLLPTYRERFFVALYTGLARQGASSGLQPRVRFSTREDHHVWNGFMVMLLSGVLAIAIISAFIFL